ncbi:coiled-coil domain-containing protein 42 homolog [Macrosteles quadrilineatus]|uniref:coiled-coil domain-containing protein 42 homolog n=1 Tax=Macrosteles quadrilineatus TaxID=74068 RepID=UPI0023E0E312|nr:coiled-coil domain-containing protein 42 homolog [Macrosteles quadrilineatus]
MFGDNFTFESSPQPPSELRLPHLTLKNTELKKRQAIEDLALQKILSSKIEKDNKKEWEELENNKEKLMKLFTDSNETIHENRASASRFFEIIREQREEQVKTKQEILNAHVDIDNNKQIKETMEKYVKQYSVFEQFLESVAAASKSGNLNSVGDILNRYQTLEGRRAEILRILEEEMELEAQMRKQMIELVEEKSTQMKALDNRLVMLQTVQRQTQERRVFLEMVVQRLKNKVSAGQEESNVLRGACRDLYLQVCKRRGVQPSATTSDTRSQLDYIQKSIMFYKEVLTIGQSDGGNQNGNIIVRKKKLK